MPNSNLFLFRRYRWENRPEKPASLQKKLPTMIYYPKIVMPFTIWALISMQIGLDSEQEKQWFEFIADPEDKFLAVEIIANAYLWSRHWNQQYRVT